MTKPTPMRVPDPSTPVEQAWHAHVDDLPPPALDATILAAAHRAAQSAPVAVAAKRKFRTPPRWWMPLAAAATLGAVTLGIVQLAPDGDEAFAPVATPPRKAMESSPAPAQERAAGASSAPEAARTDHSMATAKTDALRAPAGAGRIAPAPTPPEKSRDASANSGRASVLAQDRPAIPFPAAAPPSAPAPSPAPSSTSASANAPPSGPAPAPSAASLPAPAPMQAPAGIPQVAAAPAASPEPFPGSVAKREAMASRAAVPEARGEAADAATAPSARDRLAASPPPIANSFAGARPRSATRTDSGAQAGNPTPSNPDEWMTRIAKLHNDGNDVAAATELRAFRAAYPDADRRLPPDLREWAATIRP